MTSFWAGFVIFSVLGYMSKKTGKPIDKVATEGRDMSPNKFIVQELPFMRVTIRAFVKFASFKEQTVK